MILSKLTISFFIMLLCSWVSLFSQDTILSSPRQDFHLRAHIKLVDLSGDVCICENLAVDTLYKFELIALSSGVYSQKYIYVCVSAPYIYQFNRPKKIDNDYWWVLIKTDQVKNHIPVYRHGGNY